MAFVGFDKIRFFQQTRHKARKKARKIKIKKKWEKRMEKQKEGKKADAAAQSRMGSSRMDTRGRPGKTKATAKKVPLSGAARGAAHYIRIPNGPPLSIRRAGFGASRRTFFGRKQKLLHIHRVG